LSSTTACSFLDADGSIGTCIIDADGKERWLTLPLKKAPRNVLIRDLRFSSDAANIFFDRLLPFPLAAMESTSAAPIVEALRAVSDTPVDYIERLLARIVNYLGLLWSVIRSTKLNLPASLRGQDRILEVVRKLGARRYVICRAAANSTNPMLSQRRE
jgi:WbqC-like protein family